MLLKKYTEDHEWIELEPGSKIGRSPVLCFPHHVQALGVGCLLRLRQDILFTNIPPHFTGTMGITSYASKALGDVVYVELPEKGLEVSKGDTLGAVESVKSASDILSPVSGTVTDANELLADKPGVINKGPEGEGWFAKIEIQDEKELDGLMTKEEYDAFEKE